MDSTQKLEKIIGTGSGAAAAAVVDPVALASAWRDAEAQRRRSSSKQRIAEIGRPCAEKLWREQVQQRKALERQRRVAEAEAAAAAAAEAAERANQPVPEPVDDSPLGLARAAWAQEARKREEARAAAAETHLEKEREFLSTEWAPSLTKHRADLRAKREAEDRAVFESRQQEAWRARREQDAMAGEDRRAASFVASADLECARREGLSPPINDPAVWHAVQNVLQHKRKEVELAQNAAEAERRSEEERRLEEEAKKERDYLEWRQQVRSERCAQQRVKERQDPQQQVDQAALRKLELQGRDYFAERELHQRDVLESSLRQAASRVPTLREAGRSPRQVLDEARKTADRQRKIKEEKEPQRAEQELWDAMLAKNRQQVRKREADGSRPLGTPRWGCL